MIFCCFFVDDWILSTISHSMIRKSSKGPSNRNIVHAVLNPCLACSKHQIKLMIFWLESDIGYPDSKNRWILFKSSNFWNWMKNIFAIDLSSPLFLHIWHGNSNTFRLVPFKHRRQLSFFHFWDSSAIYILRLYYI